MDVSLYSEKHFIYLKIKKKEKSGRHDKIRQANKRRRRISRNILIYMNNRIQRYEEQ